MEKSTKTFLVIIALILILVPLRAVLIQFHPIQIDSELKAVGDTSPAAKYVVWMTFTEQPEQPNRMPLLIGLGILAWVIFSKKKK